MTEEVMTVGDAVALRKEFPPESIGKIPKGGVQLDYVGHAATTDRLLQVDPRWTWEPAGFTDHGLPMFDESGGLWIRLTVCGVTRYGYGDGDSVKECIGDAIRNAAMRFGVALDLWSKEELPGASEREVSPVVTTGKPGARDGEGPTPAPVVAQPVKTTDDLTMLIIEVGKMLGGGTAKIMRYTHDHHPDWGIRSEADIKVEQWEELQREIHAALYPEPVKR